MVRFFRGASCPHRSTGNSSRDRAQSRDRLAFTGKDLLIIRNRKADLTSSIKLYALVTRISLSFLSYTN